MPSAVFVRFSGRILTEGIEIHPIEGVDVAVFEPAKTVVDCFCFRNKIGLDIALKGLRGGLRRRRVTPDRLWRYAMGRPRLVGDAAHVETLVADGA